MNTIHKTLTRSRVGDHTKPNRRTTWCYKEVMDVDCHSYWSKVTCKNCLSEKNNSRWEVQRRYERINGETLMVEFET